MGVRPEHLQGVLRRITRLEELMKLLCMQTVTETLIKHAKGEDAVKLLIIFDDVFYDRGKYVFDDFNEALKEAAIAEIPEVKDHVKHLLQRIAEFLKPLPELEPEKIVAMRP